MNSKRWQDQFSEEVKSLEQAYNAAESDVSMLAYALDKQIISEAAYFSWVLANFDVPLLKVSYFGDHPSSGQIWEKYGSLYKWSADCLPISEWDGHLYVACLEPTEFPSEMKVIPILCPLSGLRQIWQKYQSSMSFELLDEKPTTPDDVQTDETLELDTPAELSFENQMEGLLTDSSPISLTKSTAETPIDTEVTQVPVDASTFNEPTPAAVVPITQPVPKAELPGSNSSPAIVSISGDLDNYFLGTIEKGNPQKFKLDCELLFKSLNDIFPKNIILGTDHNLILAKVIAWDTATSANSQAQPVDLRTASIFKIVVSTQKPFHGPVAANEVNSHFFSNWNNQQTPENLTIVPIISNDKVIAMVISFGQVSHYNRTTLQTAEKAADEFSGRIIPGKAMAA